MLGDDRAAIVYGLIVEHLKSPSLQHMRDAYAVQKLATEIVAALARQTGLWQKWTEPRDALARAAAPCWVPLEDLTAYLNKIPGSPLTRTDVAQRLRAIHEEPFRSYPNEELQAGCVAIYQREKEAGTELVAIVGALQEHVEAEEARLVLDGRERRRRQAEEQREALEQRFLSGADCKWTRLGKSKELYCRLNGRTYRLSSRADDKWDLHRVSSPDDDAGVFIGIYGRRGDATKVLDQLAYAREGRR